MKDIMGILVGFFLLHITYVIYLFLVKIYHYYDIDKSEPEPSKYKLMKHLSIVLVAFSLLDLYFKSKL